MACDTGVTAGFDMDMASKLGVTNKACKDFLNFNMAVECPNNVCTFPIDFSVQFDICKAAIMFMTGGSSSLIKTIRTAKKTSDRMFAAWKLKKKMQKAKRTHSGCEMVQDFDPLEKLLSCLTGGDGNVPFFDGVKEVIDNIFKRFAMVAFSFMGEVKCHLFEPRLEMSDSVFRIDWNLPALKDIPMMVKIKAVLLALVLLDDAFDSPMVTHGCNADGLLEVMQMSFLIKFSAEQMKLEETCKPVAYPIPEWVNDAVE